MDTLNLDFSSPLWYLPATALGACVGSFLNVVIHRLPLGLSVNHPKRSFCPLCRKDIAWWHNIPLISWIYLRGRCASCKAPIPFRYWLVECLTALLFAACWHQFGVIAAPALFLFCALLVAITFIDAAHQIIPLALTTIGSVAALVFSSFHTSILELATTHGADSPWWGGLRDSALGWVLGFFGLWAVVLLGKLAFGKKIISFEKSTAWEIIDATHDDEPLLFRCDGEDIPWHDLFYRKSDQLILECTEIHVDATPRGSGTLTIRAEQITLPDGSTLSLEKIRTLSGNATRATIPREAMGMGDPHLLGMIGAFLGSPAVLFTVCASVVYALAAAMLGRIGFGKPLPFGPFLALAALTWLFGGWNLWQMYSAWVLGY
jgi:leader peptidase (prepilin peptidase) / N-methyltransferase